MECTAQPSDKWESHREILGKAIVLKTDGNTAYKGKDYQTAIRKYHRSLIMLKAVGMSNSVEAELLGDLGGEKPPKDMIQQRNQLQSECNNNLAACLLTRDKPDYQRIVDLCEKVLEFDPANVKAAYRMGTALLQLGNLDRAHDVVTSQPAFQSEKQIQVLLKSIMKQEKVAEQKLKATYQKMFMSDSSQKQFNEVNKTSHPDPILIKRNVSENSQESSTGDAAAHNQGPKIIEVSSFDKEAAC